MQLYLLVGLMQLLWSGNFLVGKIALRQFPALLLASLRVLIAGLCVLPIYWLRERGRSNWTARDLPLLALLALIGVSLNQFFFVVGLSRTSVAHSALIIGMTPISVLLIAAARGLEKITARKIGGMVAAFAGVAVLSTEKVNGAGPTLMGDLITLLASFAFALYTVLGKEVNPRFSSVTMNTFLFGFGALFLLPVFAWQAIGFDFSQISTSGWLAVTYMGVFPSLVCYLIFYYALGFIAASRLSTLAYLQPLMATLLAVIFLGDRISIPLVLGGVIIFAGVYVTERG
jgi:drug/metabolite transporter (DMT)-like permease